MTFDGKGIKLQKQREASARYRDKHKDKVSASNQKALQKMRDERPQFSMYYSAKRRAKVKNLPFDLSIEDIIIPEYCPILNIKLVVGKGSTANPDSPTLDKIIPALGYVKGNVQVISRRANTMKSDANFHELHLFADWVKMEIPSVI